MLPAKIDVWLRVRLAHLDREASCWSSVAKDKHGSSVGVAKGLVVGPFICGAGIGAHFVRKSSFVRGSPPKTGVSG